MTAILNRATAAIRSPRFLQSAQLGLAGLIMLAASSGHAAQISDASTCEAAVAEAEKAIVRTALSADDLNTLVSLADQAKSACSESDFEKASKITDAIEAKIAEVQVK